MNPLTNHSSENKEPPPPPPAEHNDSAAVAGHIGRSYDCVYCKRGFNTAQALGGHMNIHRKDRVKTHSSNNNKPYNNNNNNSIHVVPIPIYNYNNRVLQHQLSGRTCFTGSTSASAAPPCLNLLGEDWEVMKLSLEKKKEKKGRVYRDDDDDVDLELRLGHDR